jgi:hypothetical protein
MARRRTPTGRAPFALGSGSAGDRDFSALEGRTATKRPRPPWWPVGVESELEMMLLTRLEAASLPLGQGQYRFFPGHQYRWDRCWVAQMVAVEVQGGVWSNGAHSRGSGVQRDCLKLSIGAALGWRVLPVTREMIESGRAVELIAQALEVTP